MLTTSITVTETPLVNFCLCHADDALVLGHRLSEWSGKAPMLEEDLALSNIALDLIGQARALYQYAGGLCGRSEDELAYLRDEHGYRNLLLTEQPNGDFATTIVRQFLFTTFADPFWGAWYGAPGYGYGYPYGPRWGHFAYFPIRGNISWGYGWYDPWFNQGFESYIVYQSGISLKIDRRADGQRLFEGKAEAASLSNRLAYLVPNLVDALFTDFPGHNGETVRISVAPEKNK